MRWAVIVTGSRRLVMEAHFPMIRADLEVYGFAEQVIVIHGDYEGADQIAKAAAKELGFDAWGVPYFGHRGRAGGPARNRCLVDLGVTLRKHEYGLRLHGYPDRDSVGTHHCVGYAKSHGVECAVREVL